MPQHLHLDHLICGSYRWCTTCEAPLDQCSSQSNARTINFECKDQSFSNLQYKDGSHWFLEVMTRKTLQCYRKQMWELNTQSFPVIALFFFSFFFPTLSDIKANILTLQPELNHRGLCVPISLSLPHLRISALGCNGIMWYWVMRKI